MAADRIAIGLMSGTSADGVDAVACRVRGRGMRMTAEVIGHSHRAYPAALRRELLAVMAPVRTRTEGLCRLDWRLGEFFASAAVGLMTRLRLAPAGVTVIGSHGQTICHDPAHPATLQLGRAAVIAERTGCPVVSDFRSADMAAGGQGAPLVPWTDWLLLRDRRRSRAVQNIGGIGNVTLLPADAEPGDVVAFDTGPGNMIIDEIARRFSRNRRQFDAGGRGARRGRPDGAVLSDLMSHAFLRRRPPKSCGREEFGGAFTTELLRRHRRRKLSEADWLATATAFTVQSIGRAYEEFLPGTVDEVILCGGGARNATLTAMLTARLPRVRMRAITEFGIDATAKEGLSFGLLACAFVDGVTANLPQVTGARRGVVLGQYTRA